MRVSLLNDGGHKSIQGLSFPVEVEAFYHPTNRKLITVHENELRRVGGDSKYMTVDDLTIGMAYFSPSEYSIAGETPCIRDMCCNQFGERDEMQNIINSLQADVIARGARIKMLEDEMVKAVFILQSDVETKVDDALDVLGIHNERL